MINLILEDKATRLATETAEAGVQTVPSSRVSCASMDTAGLCANYTMPHSHPIRNVIPRKMLYVYQAMI